MTIALIQAALERRLFTLLAPADTAVENKAFTPKTGVPYARIFHLLNNPLDIDLERSTVQERGIFQVSLFYPLDAGRLPAMTRAQQIRELFKPVQFLNEGAVQVEINNTPRIGGGSPDGDRWHVPVSISWVSFETS